MGKFVLLVILLATGDIRADTLSNKIQAGLTRDAVVALMEAPPDQEACKTVWVVQSCLLVWKRGVLTRTTYEVLLVANRVVSITTKIDKLLPI